MERATLVLLHGRQHEAATMHELVRRAGLEGQVDVIAPAAPGASWYPDRFFSPRAANEPSLSAALARVDELLDGIAARGVPPARTLLGGFSQGACLACDYVARHPRPLGAVAVLCGGLIGLGAGELAAPAPGVLDGLPVLLTATEQDAWVPVERVEASARALRRAGADVDLRVFGPGVHGVRDEEVAAVGDLVRGLDTRPLSEEHSPTAQ